MNNPWRLNLAVGLVAIASGLTGSVCSLFLRSIQHLSFGWHYDGFWLQISHDPPTQRFLILCLAGLVAGMGWWTVGKLVYSLPIFSALTDNILQLISAGMGSPLGREAAPREISAMFAGWISKILKMDINTSTALKNLAAGAALGAIYNVPLSGALFAFESLKTTRSWHNFFAAIFVSGISIIISWFVLGRAPQYQPVDFQPSFSLLLGCLFLGPIIWKLGSLFGKYSSTARSNAISGKFLIIACLINFACVGIFSIWYPAVLGNGKNAAGLEFAELLSWHSTLVLLLIRALITFTTLKTGARGGLLTPSLATGALLGAVLGGLWLQIWPGSNMASFALVSAAVFLGASQKIPITAFVFIPELTGALQFFATNAIHEFF